MRPRVFAISIKTTKSTLITVLNGSNAKHLNVHIACKVNTFISFIFLFIIFFTLFRVNLYKLLASTIYNNFVIEFFFFFLSSDVVY
jgi:hypothetical protein